MNKQPTNQPPKGREALKGIIKHFISDCLFERHPSVESITEGIMHIISTAPPATVIPPFPDKMTFKEMLTNLFNTDFLYVDELQTICDAGEMYATGCLRQAATVIQPSGLQDAVEKLEDIMTMFGEAHNLLAKTKLTTEEYQPISSLLANGKIELFRIYNTYKPTPPPQPLGEI